MLRSLYAGVSGLRNSQIRLDVIGNNIANVNTIGFKASRVTFKDMLSQTLQAATSSQSGRGGVNPMQVGMGVAVGSIDTDHTQGSRESTGRGTDLSIEGNGFFILRSGNSTVYTRAGAFDLDENGYLVVPGSGLKVQGWVNGKLQDIVISNGTAYSAEPSTVVNFANNLDAYAEDGATFTTTVDVYDSLGGLHTVTLKFTKVGSAGNTVVNSWVWEMIEPQVFEPPAPTTKVVFSGNLDASVSPITGDLSVFDAAGNSSTLSNTFVIDSTAHTVTLTGLVDEDANPIVLNYDAATGEVSPTVSEAVLPGGDSLSLDFSGLTVTASATTIQIEPNGNANNQPVTQSGQLDFGADGRLLMQNNNSVWFRPQVEKTVDWEKTNLSVDNDGNIAPLEIDYVGIDGSQRKITVTYDKISDGLYNWTAVDGADIISQGTYSLDEDIHVGEITYSAYGAASKMNLTLDFSEVTSSAGETTLAVAHRDGAPNGSLKSYSIDSSGSIVGEFTNGMLRSIGQVALARFANPAGLQKAGDTTFIESNNSGIAQLGRAGTVGFGTITPGSLEMSNVDLSQEFTNMIVTQRGLQANSRIITTSDEVLQEVVNLKR